MTKAVLRGHVLRWIATISSLAAFAALLDPDRVANAMGVFLVGVNGYSQFFAVYVGLRLAVAALALVAAHHSRVPLLGDLVAMFLLAQPLGRLAAASVIGLPHGTLLVVSVLEAAAGILLLALRPALDARSGAGADDIHHPQGETPHR